MTEYVKCVECGSIAEVMLWHPSGLCRPCYLAFKQRLRDGDVQGVE